MLSCSGRLGSRLMVFCQTHESPPPYRIRHRTADTRVD
ncbi:hypothetical protein BTZ20_3218 [Rhodococcus sp. MTM3W5.2]|nr:hypothetical protein BTZ20_3218 [Rhodococcus sp. MTM3W5.2]